MPIKAIGHKSHGGWRTCRAARQRDIESLERCVHPLCTIRGPPHLPIHYACADHRQLDAPSRASPARGVPCPATAHNDIVKSMDTPPDGDKQVPDEEDELHKKELWSIELVL